MTILTAFCLIPARSNASEWSMQLSPFIGIGHSSFSSDSQSVSGAQLGVQRQIWQTDEVLFSSVLGLHSLNSYFKSNSPVNSAASNNRHMNAFAGIQTESRRTFSALGLKPFMELGLGYGRSEIKVTENNVDTYTEYNFHNVDSSLLKMTLGLLFHVTERASISLAYNYLQQRYQLGRSPDDSYQEHYQVNSGLSLTTTPKAQAANRSYSGKNLENIHAAQLGLSVKL